MAICQRYFLHSGLPLSSGAWIKEMRRGKSIYNKVAEGYGWTVFLQEVWERERWEKKCPITSV